MGHLVNGTDPTIHRLEEHAHSVQFVAPDLATGITATAVNDANTWDLGAASATILTAAAWCDIHQLDIYAISAAGEYQINIYDDGDLIISQSFSKASVVSDNYVRIEVQSRMIAPGSVITAKLASATNDGETVKVKIAGHYYS